MMWHDLARALAGGQAGNRRGGSMPPEPAERVRNERRSPRMSTADAFVAKRRTPSSRKIND